MTSKWLILGIIIFIYMPVSIDATVLHIAVPSLSLELGASASELLWIIDIYSLIMAGLLLPMGALGDRLGYKTLAIAGLVIFGLASLLAAMAINAAVLIIARALLAVGGAMILPATLAGVRKTFLDDKERAMALGIWTAVGVGGAAIGPLVGGYLLQYFYWGAVFLINIPIVIIALIAILVVVPEQEKNINQKWALGRALFFISGILLLIYAIKALLKGDSHILLSLAFGMAGFIIIFYFVKSELHNPAPMIDFSLLKNPVLAMGTIMAATSMISIVGFELLMAQELQFVYGLSPLNAGLFMLPLMLASGVGGPIAGKLVATFGLKVVATSGIVMSSLSFLGLSFCNFSDMPYLIGFLMVILGLSVGIALLASTMAIMSTAPEFKSASAGAIEGMAYELGAGFGVVFFGMMLTIIYSHNVILPAGLSESEAALAASSISEAFRTSKDMGSALLGDQLVFAAKAAFVGAHKVVLMVAGALLGVLSYFVWRYLPYRISVVEES